MEMLITFIIGLFLGIGLGLLWKESEVKKEIKLRKEWETMIEVIMYD